MIAFIYCVVSVLVTWIAAHFYYHRSSTRTPKWAEPIIQNLPSDPPTLSQLLRLFQKHLDSGDIQVHPALGRVACPECGEPARNFEEKVFGDDAYTILVATCPSCGWSEHVEV